MTTLQKAKMAVLGILFLGTTAMFLIAGNMVFAAGSIIPHIHLGRGLSVVAMALPVLAWLDSRRDLIPSLLVVALFLLQSVTRHGAGPLPWLGALHTLLGAVVFVGLIHMIQAIVRRTKAPAA